MCLCVVYICVLYICLALYELLLLYTIIIYYYYILLLYIIIIYYYDDDDEDDDDDDDEEEEEDEDEDEDEWQMKEPHVKLNTRWATAVHVDGCISELSFFNNSINMPETTFNSIQHLFCKGHNAHIVLRCQFWHHLLDVHKMAPSGDLWGFPHENLIRMTRMNQFHWLLKMDNLKPQFRHPQSSVKYMVLFGDRTLNWKPANTL